MQRHLSKRVRQKSAALLIILCCAVALAGCWSASEVLAAPTTHIMADAGCMPAQSKCVSEDIPSGDAERITLYGGNYAITLRNLRFEPDDDRDRTMSLVVDVVYISQSPFGVLIDHNQQFHALVVDQSGQRLGGFSPGVTKLAPGDMATVTLHLGSGYTVSAYAGTRFTVSFRDAGNNLLGQATAQMPVSMSE
jgi:hypothetical protein